MKKIIFISALCLIALSMNAQLNTFNKHIKKYSGPFANRLQALAQTNDKGYILCRGSYDTTTLHGFYELIKYDKEGDPVWAKKMDAGKAGTNHTVSTCVIKTTEGGLMIGTSVYNAALIPEMALIKTDSTGNVQWSKKYPGTGSGTINSMEETSDHGYIACGYTDSASIRFACIFKTDASGNLSWSKKCIVSGNTAAGFSSVKEIPGQGYVATGYSGTVNSAALIVKFDPAGNALWDKNISTGYGSALYSVSSTQDNSLVFAGACEDGFHSYLLLLKTDQSGAVIATKSARSAHPVYNGMYASSIKENNNGNLVFSSYIANPIPAIALTETDLSFNVNWCRQYYYTFHTFNYEPCSFTQTTDNGYAYTLLGGTHTGPGNDFSTILVKTDSLGQVGCDGNPYPINLIDTTFTFSGNTVISNSGSALPFSAVFVPMVVSDTTWCENILDHSTAGIAENESKASQIENYPNPFTERTTLSYYLQSRAACIDIAVYDSKGMKLYSLSQNDLPAGKHFTEIPCAEFAEGIYFYSLMVDGQRFSGKIIKAK